ncbi:cadherin-like domain-containing protein [Terasakiella sp. A23]|uniref:cadherin-like domain-containing protein n=1 Tax=Terasakiella sp. FCG-A23 TaxID=3080561 RepID=UPI002954704D|nr:cadherin-like domain-containing protein [Terasakiella sp. A23]MDV7340544.1 cadherin-like domain-containing protein [Terasakiella sp. A23]
MLNTPGGDEPLQYRALDSDAGQITLPEGLSLHSANFVRDGSDLLIETEDGSVFVAPGYFATETLADLTTPNGDFINGTLFENARDVAAQDQFAQVEIPGLDLPAPADAIPDGIGEPIGTVDNVEGAVSVTHVDGTTEFLNVGDKVYQGDILETETGSGIGITLADTSVFSLGEEGQLVLDELVYDPGNQEGSAVISLVEGTASFVSGQIAKINPDAVNITTPVATIGIRGTKVFVEYKEGEFRAVNLLETTLDGEQAGEIVIYDNAGGIIGTTNEANIGWSWNPTTSSRPTEQSFTTNQIETMTRDAQRNLPRNLVEEAVDAREMEQALQEAAEQAAEEAQAAQEDANQAELDAEQAKEQALLAQQEAEALLAQAAEDQALLEAALEAQKQAALEQQEAELAEQLALQALEEAQRAIEAERLAYEAAKKAEEDSFNALQKAQEYAGYGTNQDQDTKAKKLADNTDYSNVEVIPNSADDDDGTDTTFTGFTDETSDNNDTTLVANADGDGDGDEEDTTTTTSQNNNDTAVTVTLNGTAVDGYIKGATVFIDLNKNGVLDDNENVAGATYTTTGTEDNPSSFGTFVLSTTAEDYVISLTGGTDIATDKPFYGVLQAPAGSTVITPLTTMLVALMDADPALDVAAAQAKLATALNFDNPALLDLTQHDPVAGSNGTLPDNIPTADHADYIQALTKVTAVGVQIQNTIMQAANVFEAAAGDGVTLEQSTTSAALFDSLAQSIKGLSATEKLPLDSAATLEKAIKDAAALEDSGGNTIFSPTLITNVNAVAEQTAQIIQASNETISNLIDAIDSNSDGGALLTQLAQVAVVAEAASQEFNQISTFDSTSLDGLKSSYVDTLDSKLSDAKIGDINGDGTASLKPVSLQGTEDQILTITKAQLIANNTFPESSTINVLNPTSKNGGTLTETDTGWTYTPVENNSSNVTFTYDLEATYSTDDGPQTQTISTSAVARFTAVADNTLQNDSDHSVANNSTVDINILANDTIDTNKTLTLSTPSNGTVTLNDDNTVTYDPSDDFTGNDSFTYTITETDGATQTATVQITVSETGDETPPPPPVDNYSGKALDGYLQNANVFIDLDKDGVLDANEIASIVMTDSDGDFTISTTETDYVISVVGGTDASTGAAFYGALQAPKGDGTSIISPLTTLMVNGVSEAQLKTQFGLGNSISLLSDDPIALANTGENTAIYSKLAAVGVQIQNIIIQAGAVLEGASSNLGGSTAASHIFTVIAEKITEAANDGNITFDLSDSNDLTAVINSTASKLSDSGVTIDTSKVSTNAAATASQISTSNADIDTAISQGKTGDDLFAVTSQTQQNATSFAESAKTAVENDQPVSNINRAPTVNTVTLENGTENISYTLQESALLANSSDLDNDTLNVTAITGTNITATENTEAGTWTLTSTAAGEQTITFTVSDGTVDVIQTATINFVDADNTLANDSVTLSEDGSSTISVLANDTIIDGATVSAISTPSNGSVTLNNDNTITYSPTANYNGSDSFTYTVTDEDGETQSATVNLTVTAVNDAPVAGDQVSLSTNEDTPLTITTTQLLGSSSDVDNDSLSIANFTIQSGNGSLVQNEDGVSWVYTPAANDDSAVTFSYDVSDGSLSDSTTATITVNAVNDAPTVNTVSLSNGTEASSYTLTETTLLANSSDIESDALTVTAVTGGSNLTITQTTNDPESGAKRWTITSSEEGAETITFTVSDGTNSVNQTATITFADIDNTLTNDTVTLTEDGSTTISVLSNDTIIDGGTVTATSTPSHGSVTINNDNTVTYTAASDYAGSDSFSYTVTDEDGETQTATVNLTVTADADAPTLNMSLGTGTEITVNGDASTVTITKDNVTATGNGYTITGKAQSNHTPNADDIATYASDDGTVSGFGVTGDQSGNHTEIGYQSFAETLYVDFDTNVSSVSVAFAWLSSSETASYEFFLNGSSVGSGTRDGVTDAIDTAITLAPSNGSQFDQIVFKPDAQGDDFLINSLSFDKPSTTTAYVDIPIYLSHAETDTDGSETLSSITLSGIPDTATLYVDNSAVSVSSGSATLANDNLDNVKIRVTDTQDNFDLTASITSTDGNDTAITTQTVNVPDYTFASSGNDDVIAIQSGNVTIDGGTGTDTLQLEAGFDPNFVTANITLTSVEIIDLATDTSANSITIGATQINSGSVTTINGNGSDTLTFADSSGWSQGSTDQETGYTTYNYSQNDTTASVQVTSTVAVTGF